MREPDDLRRYLVPQPMPRRTRDGGAGDRRRRRRRRDIHILEVEHRLPLAGHTARHAMGEIYEAIAEHRTTLVFVNTRMQAEFMFQELWRVNEDGLAIALHHGSLDVGQRRKVEAAMIAGKLRAVVCTSTLDLGIDWGDVDLVINVGAPKGASRLMQRIGRANHRLDEPSQALLVPANRFEIMECRAALDAVGRGRAGHAGGADRRARRAGPARARHGLRRRRSTPTTSTTRSRPRAPYAGLSAGGFRRAWSPSSPPAATR